MLYFSSTRKRNFSDKACVCYSGLRIAAPFEAASRFWSFLSTGSSPSSFRKRSLICLGLCNAEDTPGIHKQCFTCEIKFSLKWETSVSAICSWVWLSGLMKSLLFEECLKALQPCPLNTCELWPWKAKHPSADQSVFWANTAGASDRECWVARSPLKSGGLC